MNTGRQISSLQRKQVDLRYQAQNNFPFPPPPPRRSEHNPQGRHPQRKCRSRSRSPGRCSGQSPPRRRNCTHSPGKRSKHSPTHQRSRSPFKGQPPNTAPMPVLPTRKEAESNIVPPPGTTHARDRLWPAHSGKESVITAPPAPAPAPALQATADSVKPTPALPSGSTLAARAQRDYYLHWGEAETPDYLNRPAAYSWGCATLHLN